MLLASRDIAGGIRWVKGDKETAISQKRQKNRKGNLPAAGSAERNSVSSALVPSSQLVANAATHLGMEVYGLRSIHLRRCSMEPVPRHPSHPECRRYLSHLRLYHHPYCRFWTAQKGMINKAAIDEMKDGVVLLNYARRSSR